MSLRLGPVLAVVAALWWLAFPPAGLGAPPLLVSIAEGDQQPTITWSLPPGMISYAVEIATSPELDQGEFRAEKVVAANYVLDSAATSWTADRRLVPGTYYVHVGGRNTQCTDCPLFEWSEIKAFVIEGALRPPKLAGLRGTVVRVIDGDTLVVRLDSGKRQEVQLIGIDAPERGECFTAKSTARARELALDRRVVLKGDAGQATEDRFGRKLAYVLFPGGKDLARELIAGGFARVYVAAGIFKRLAAYRKAGVEAQNAGRGQWSACRSGH